MSGKVEAKFPANDPIFLLDDIKPWDYEKSSSLTKSRTSFPKISNNIWVFEICLEEENNKVSIYHIAFWQISSLMFSLRHPFKPEPTDRA